MLIAGEASGDQIGAPLVRELKVRYPGAQIAGIGGAEMEDAGCECWWHYRELAVMGLVEVIKHLPRLLKLRRELVDRCIAFAPDCFVGIDAPDFNLGVAKRLKQQGLTTVHYVSPSIWAWRRKRAKKIGQAVHKVLCLFPFEPELYAEYGVAAKFVGHPLADQVPLGARQVDARAELGLELERQVVAVLPGSRSGELQRMGPIFAAAVQQLLQANPELQVISAAPDEQAKDTFSAHLSEAKVADQVRLFVARSQTVMQASDVVLLASGTATLEALLAGKPMVVGYKVAELSYRLVRFFGMLKVQYFSLPNTLADRPLVPEFMQHEFTAAALAEAVLDLLTDPERAQAMTEGFTSIHRELRCNSAEQAAASIAGLIRS